MSRRGRDRSLAQHSDAAVLGSMASRALLPLTHQHTSEVRLAPPDRQRLGLLADLLASARRGAQPMDGLIQSRAQARLSFVTDPTRGDLPSLNEDRSNYQLLVHLHPGTGRDDTAAMLERAEEVIQVIRRHGDASSLGSRQRDFIRDELQPLLVKMSHVNDGLRREPSRILSDT